MLESIPTVGQWVKVLETRFEHGVPYQTAGDIHEIEKVSHFSGSACFKSDDGRPVYIDEAAFEEYELYSNQDFYGEDERVIQLSLTAKELTSVTGSLGNVCYRDIATFAKEYDLPLLAEEEDERFFEALLAKINEQKKTEKSDSSQEDNYHKSPELSPDTITLELAPEELAAIVGYMSISSHRDIDNIISSNGWESISTTDNDILFRSLREVVNSYYDTQESEEKEEDETSFFDSLDVSEEVVEVLDMITTVITRLLK